MNNKGKTGGFGIYVVVIAVIAILYLLMSQLGSQSGNYSYDTFVSDVNEGNVSGVVIRQNSEVPTGILYVSFDDNREQKSLNVSDVNEVQELLRDKGVTYELRDVTRQSIWVTTIIPFGI